MLSPQWVWFQICRVWYRLFRKQAVKRFRSRLFRVEGLLEQEAVGRVNPVALSALAAELEELGVRLPAINGERAPHRLRDELRYLQMCMEANEDYLSLELARARFSTDPMGDAEWTKDALGAAYDERREKADRRK